MKKMVKAILCNILFFAVCYVGNAQSDSGKQKNKSKTEESAIASADVTKKSKRIKNSSVKAPKYSFLNNGDYVMLVDGNVYRKINGKVHPVTNVEYLQGGLKVMPDGTLIKSNGGRIELTNGEVVNANGDLVKGDANWVLNEKIAIARTDFKVVEDRSREMEDKLALMDERLKLMNEKANMEEEKIDLLRSATLCVTRMTREEKIDLNGKLQLVDDRLQVVNTKLNDLNDQVAKNTIYK